MNKNILTITKQAAHRLDRRLRKLAVLIIAGLLIAAMPGSAQNITRPNIAGPAGLQVNSYTGSLYYSRTDMMIPGQGLSLDISFSYNSADRSKDYGYGFGWTFMYNRFYSADSNGLAFHSPDGRQDLYTFNSQTYKAPTGIFDVLTEYAAGKFRLVSKDKTEFFFDDSTHKKLTRIRERNGNLITLVYSGKELTSITDASNREITFTWSSGHVTEIRSQASSPGRSILYQFNGAGCLIAVRNAEGHMMQYTYGPGKVMTSATDWNGNVTNIIYNSNRAVIKLVSCQSERSISYNVSQRKTYLVEKNGTKNIVSVYTFDEAGRLIDKEGNCCGYKNSYSYDSDNNINQVTDTNGNKTLYTYDRRGNILTETDPAGRIIRYTYDTAFNRVTSVTDKNGNKTTLSYDNRGNLVSVTDALNQVIQYTYDAKGNQVSSKDAKNNTTTTTHDNNGYPVSITDAAGGVRVFTYDNWGNILTQKDANNHTTAMTYDAVNRMLSVTDPAGGITEYVYDGNGNRLSLKDPNNNTTSYTYDAHNNLFRITDALGHITGMSYDAMDNVTAVTDANGKMTTYDYDNLNRVTVETNAAGETKRYGYDGNGNRTTVIYPTGNTLNVRYDALNRITTITDVLGTIASYTYDANGNKIAETDGKSNTRTHKYDALNRLVSMTDGTGVPYKYEYDANSNLLRETDRNNNATVYTYDALDRQLTSTDALGYVTTNTYDAENNLLSIRDARGNITRYTYDALDRNTEELFADNTKKQYTYDPSGNLIKRIDNSGQATTYIYDKLNRPVVRAYTATSDSLSYDATGHLLSAKNKDAIIQFTYDAADRVASEVLNGKTTSYSYNTASRVKKITYPGGRMIERVLDVRNQLNIIREGAGAPVASFVFDAGGQNTGRTYANRTSTNAVYNSNKQVTDLSYNPSRFVDLGYSYDKEDNPIATQFRHHATSSEQYSYDKLNQLTKVNKNSGGQSVFNYDGVGNRTTAQVNGSTVSYTANSMNAYSSITDDDVITPSYDGNGNTTSDGNHTYAYDEENRIVTVDNGTTATYRYDALGRRIQKIAGADTINYFFDGLQIIEERNGGNEVSATYIWGTWLDDIVSMQRNGQAYYFHTNAIGSVMAATDGEGKVVERYEYDGFGKVAFYDNTYAPKTSSTIGNSYTFSGRQYETESGLYFYRARFYDPVWGRFLQKDPLRYVDGMGLYSYVSNQPTDRLDPLGLEGIDWGCIQQMLNKFNDFFGGARDAVKNDIVDLFHMVTHDIWQADFWSQVGSALGSLTWQGVTNAIYETVTDMPNWSARDWGQAFGHIGFAVAGPKGLNYAGKGVSYLGRSLNGLEAAEAGGAGINRIYSATQLMRRADDVGPFHNFPESFDNVIFSDGTKTIIPNYYNQAKPGLSNTTILYEMPGSISTKSGEVNVIREGVYQIGVRPSTSGQTEVIIHRSFKPTRK